MWGGQIEGSVCHHPCPIHSFIHLFVTLLEKGHIILRNMPYLPGATFLILVNDYISFLLLT